MNIFRLQVAEMGGGHIVLLLLFMYLYFDNYFFTIYILGLFKPN